MKLSIHFRSTLFVLTTLAATGNAAGQELVKQMVSKFRQSVVYLSVSRTTETGAVIQSIGTGFIISNKGHVLTNCHVVDKILRNPDGSELPAAVDQVTVLGATASKEAPLEAMSVISCAQAGIDFALLKFKNSAAQRIPVPVVADPPTIGDELAAMGFSLNTEFFARPGTLSSETPDDTMLVAMVLNAGDSGAPIFNQKVRVVAVAEAGYGAGTGIGVVRPVRHAANLLAMAGVNLFAVDAAIPATPLLNQPSQSNVYSADPQSAILAFSRGLKHVPVDSQTMTVTYPVFKQLAKSSSGETPQIDVQSIAAKAGYKVTGAKFIVTDSKGLEVAHVGASPDGGGVRAAFEKAKSASISMSTEVPFIKGFIETTQERLPK